MPTDGRFYTLKEVLGMLRISRSTVERMCKRGEFPRPQKIGGRVKFFRPSVEAWIRETVR